MNKIKGFLTKRQTELKFNIRLKCFVNTYEQTNFNNNR